MPEGTIICNVEERSGDRGALARCSGNYATVISHNPVRPGTLLLRVPTPPPFQRRTFFVLCARFLQSSQHFSLLYLTDGHSYPRRRLAGRV